LGLFQKRLKYSQPTETTIALYELGFSDHFISQDLADLIGLKAGQGVFSTSAAHARMPKPFNHRARSPATYHQ
jgi:hypothetical protein